MYFRDVRHQERALTLIHGPLRVGRVPHAWLFAGPEGVGKEQAALALAARLLCLSGAVSDVEPCGQCASCRLLVSGNHPDFQLIHRGLRKHHPDRSIRASKGLFLVVDLVRHFVIEPASRLSQVSPRRVYLMRDAERMNEEAQNALLKTLEEPPADACLVLVSSSAARLLPTIRSRCAQVPFGLLPSDFVRQELQRRLRLGETEAAELATLAEGQLGLALRWHRAGLLGQTQSIRAALGMAERTEAFGKRLIEIASELGAALSDEPEDEGEESDEEADEPRPRSKSGSKGPPTDVLRDTLRLVLRVIADGQRAELAVVRGAARVIQGVLRTEMMLDRNVAPQLAAESLAVAIAESR